MTTTRLDRVFIFGDQLSFLIPNEWVESADEHNHYLYHAPNADSGWLRVSLISTKRINTYEELRSLLNERARKECRQLFEVGENIVVTWEKDSEEDGDPITHFWWAVSRYHDTKCSHEALFSYTVLRERKADPEVLRTVELLGKLVSQAKFAPPKIA